MGAHAVTPTLRKLKQENYHNLTQWVTDRTSLDHSVTLHISNEPIHTHKDKTQILINNLVNSNKQIKMQSASFQYCSIASSDSPCASFTTHCCRLPGQTEATQFLCYHHTESRFFLFWMCGEAHLPSEAAQSPKRAIWFCLPLSVHAVSLCSLAWAVPKEKHKIILACYSFVCIGIPFLCSCGFIIFWFCITKFLHVSSTWCSFNFLDS